MTTSIHINQHLKHNAFINNRLLSSFQIFLNQQDLGMDASQSFSHCQKVWSESTFYLSSLSIRNFRALKELKLNLNQNLTVIFGVNGAGKTAILDAISKSLSVLSGSIKSSNIGGPTLTEKDINSDMDLYENCEIKTTLNLNKQDTLNCSLCRAPAGSISSAKSDLSDFKLLGKTLRYLNNSRKESMPVMVFYSVRRSEKMTTHVGLSIKRYPSRENRISDLYNSSSLNGTLSLSKFEEWFIRLNRRKDFQSCREKQNFKGLILKTTPFVKDIRVNINSDGEEVIEVKIGNIFRNYSMLSDGQRIYLGLVLDLSQRLILSNPLSENPFNGKGIVLIDEIELHLHPQWQREVLPQLTAAFPNIQFIVTTHSPQVLSSIDAKHLQLLEIDENYDITARSIDYQTDGATSSEILENLMNVPLRREKSNITKKINKFLSNSLDYDYSDEELSNCYQLLQSELNPNMLKEVHEAKFARDIKKRLAMKIKQK